MRRIRRIRKSLENRALGFSARIRHKAYRIASSIYNKAFSYYLRLSPLNVEPICIIRSNPIFENLDHCLNYFIFHASYGDKWCILSFLGAHLQLYPTSRIIADNDDKPLVGLFLDGNTIEERFIFIDKHSLLSLSAHFRPISRVSTQIIDSWSAPGCQHVITPFLLANGLPAGTLKHLHAVYYPYFMELLNLHGVSYGTLIKTLLYLPADTCSSSPCHFTQDDYQAAEEISKKGSVGEGHCPYVLINVVNFSHSSLSTAQLSLVISVCIEHGYRVLVNQTQSGEHFAFGEVMQSCPQAELITIPPRLLSLICDLAEAVVGVIGGAMNIAVQFSSSHVLSLQTSALGYGVSDEELLGKWGKEKIWQWIDQDWPCLRPGRVVENAYLGDADMVRDDQLQELISCFLNKVMLVSSSI